jgi:arsenite oxidase small subunit
MSDQLPMADGEPACEDACPEIGMARRDFLFAGGFTLVSLTLPGLAGAAAPPARVARYPRKNVGLLSKLKKGEPLAFRYPHDHANCECVLLKLGREAGGGIGPDKDVVAFNGLCPHMGWSIPGRQFHADPGIAGPCRGHWTTFDLTRHGMVISGHATQGLPQVILELDKDNIVAVGILGLIFGFHDNKTAPKD